MRLPQPTFHTVGSSSEAGLEKFNALVLPLYSSDLGAVAHENDGADQLLAKSEQNLSEILAQWPEYSAKAGEILEIPIARMGKLVRLFILGFGTGSTEDARKAGAALGRKVKSTGYSIRSDYQGGYDETVAHLVAISLSQYGWSLKTQYSKSDQSARAKGATTFTFDSSLEAAVARAGILAEAVWTTRDLIHTPSI